MKASCIGVCSARVPRAELELKGPPEAGVTKTTNAFKRFTTLCCRTLVFIFLFSASICFASMTIYFKDGTSREVHKITFHGDAAELYAVDGNVLTVPVEKLDLPSSGIGAPVGTYGTSKVSGQRTMQGRPGVLGDPRKQLRLKEEWDRSEKSAVTVSTIGMIQRGDTVKIVGETTPNSSPGPEDYYDQTEFSYDPSTGIYQFKQKNLDHAYVVVYKNQDGSYGKRLFDAVTFQNHFNLNQIQQTPKPMPEYPIIPDRVEPGPSPTPPPPDSGETLEVKPEAQQQVQSQPEASSDDIQVESTNGGRRRTWISFIMFLVVLIALGIGAWFVIQRMQRPYIDTSKFKRYEEDLREFEIAIWLRNGKTVDQLMEICVKKFYQDNPGILTVCAKMLKGTQKGLMIPFITGQTGRSAAEAGAIYDQIHGQMEGIRSLIQEVSQKTGVAPAKLQVEITQKTIAQELPRIVTTPTKPAPAPPPLPKAAPAPVPEISSPGPATSSVSMNAEKGSSARLIEPDAPMRSGADLPAYASSVLNQISFLSSKDEK